MPLFVVKFVYFW